MLDESEFKEGWLNCYAPDAEFWMPGWRSLTLFWSPIRSERYP